jgi:Fe-S oxidoreductase
VEDRQLLPQLLPVVESLKSEKTMIPGMLKAERFKWSEGLNIKDLTKEKAEVAFFPGCKYSYDKELQEVLRSTVMLLTDAGVDMGYMGSAEKCCAGRAYQMGLREDFNHSAESNIKAFKTFGVKIIVTPCSDCYHTFKRLYAGMGMDIEILHTVEYIERLIQEGKIRFTKTVPITVTYHDPCHLGRQGEPHIPWEGKEKKIFNQINVWEPRKPRYNGANGIYDAPRNVLKSIPGVKLIEMERIREYSWCCGAGGGCSETLPAFSSWTAGERISEANSTGADAIVTACPWCKSNLGNAADENGKTIRVRDIVELVRQAT